MKIKKIRPQGWHWVGRTKDGAAKYVGTTDAPPAWASRLLYTLVGIEAVIGLFALIALVFGGNLGLVALVTTMSLTGIVHGGLGWWMQKSRERILAAVTKEGVAAWLGVETEGLESLLRERGVKPRYNINGRDFYDRADFGDIGTLLRAAKAPEGSETLLRPAKHTPTESGELLRPAMLEVAALEPNTAATTQEETQQVLGS